MAIEIGKPHPALSFADKGATALKVAGVVALGYGAMCMAGVTSEMANAPDVARMIYHGIEPLMKNATSVVQAIVDMTSSANENSSVFGNAPDGQKAVITGMLGSMVGATLSIAGAKLSEMVNRAKESIAEKLQWESRNNNRPAQSSNSPALSM